MNERGRKDRVVVMCSRSDTDPGFIHSNKKKKNAKT